MQYLIMRKNDVITVADFDDDGTMLWVSDVMKNIELAPLHKKSSATWLKDWWKERSIPMGQHKVERMLQEKGLIGPEDYLLRNLGLSLTDYYWVKPLDSNLKWEDVNLFKNSFRNEMQFENFATDEGDNIDVYNPNSSLQGQLEKKWIIHNEKRYLVKGNRDEKSTESINEVIVSKLHELQGYDNYTDYSLIKIKDRDYDYGCISECFTSEELELVSAYAVVTSEVQKNDISSYEHFIRVCSSYGMDEEELRRDLEYQILVDFVLSGRDRHLSNVSILRDANTMRFVRMAPIYDSGKCLFVDQGIPESEKELLNIKTNSFATTELKLLSYVRDRNLLDVTKLPGSDFIKKAYEMDSQMEEGRIKRVCEAYERKVELFRDYQLGKSLNAIKFPVRGNVNNNAEVFMFKS